MCQYQDPAPGHIRMLTASEKDLHEMLTLCVLCGAI